MPVGHQATLAGEAGVLWNTLPGVRPIFSAGIDVAWSSHFETRGAVLAATAATSSLGSGRVETELYAARGDACATSNPRRVALRACLGLAWGVVASRGIGFLEGRSPSQPWLAMPARGEVRITVARNQAHAAWGVLATTELLLTLRRAQIGVVGQRVDATMRTERTAVLTLPVLGGAATAGLFFEL